jgi:hypothetical protein
MRATYERVALVVGSKKYMPVKVKIVSSKPTPVTVRVRRAPWQQFLNY